MPSQQPQLQPQQSGAGVASSRQSSSVTVSNSIRSNESEFYTKLSSCLSHMDAFESSSAQAAALSVIPLEKLETAARDKFNTAKSRDDSIQDSLFRDILLLEFKEWFKTDFFSWVDSPLCPQCNKPTKACG